ncbi:hypothetical protein Hdeb2414_s0001g00023901 [Helianthus debilis subsp. tardiflorus]
MLKSPTIGDEEELANNGSPADIESPNNQEEPDNVDHDPGRTEKQATRLKDHVVAPILLSAVLILLGIVFGKLGNYTPLSVESPFVLISAIACGLVYLAFSVLLLMYEGPEYMILKGVYYILCNLAFDSLLVVLLFTTTKDCTAQLHYTFGVTCKRFLCLCVCVYILWIHGLAVICLLLAYHYVYLLFTVIIFIKHDLLFIWYFFKLLYTNILMSDYTLYHVL